MAPLTDRVLEILHERCAGRALNHLAWTTLRGAPLHHGNTRRKWWNKALSAVPGHTSEPFTLRRYGHLMPDDLDPFASEIPSRFGDGDHARATRGGSAAAEV